MYIDTHCHLTFPQYDADRAMVIGNAKKAGVKQFINPGVDLFSSRQSISLAQKHAGVVFAAIGIHPYEAQHDPSVFHLEQILLSSLSPKPYPLYPKIISFAKPQQEIYGLKTKPISIYYWFCPHSKSH